MTPTTADFYARFPHLSGVTLGVVTMLLANAIEEFDVNLPSYFELVLLHVAHKITMDSLAMSDEVRLIVQSTGNQSQSNRSLDQRDSYSRSAYGLEIDRILKSEVSSFMYLP